MLFSFSSCFLKLGPYFFLQSSGVQGVGTHATALMAAAAKALASREFQMVTGERSRRLHVTIATIAAAAAADFYYLDYDYYHYYYYYSSFCF